MQVSNIIKFYLKSNMDRFIDFLNLIEFYSDD